MPVSYSYTQHPREVERQTKGPLKTTEVQPSSTRVQRANAWLAVKITSGVGTMWCAYIFAIIALVSLPSVLRSHSTQALIAWIAQTFLQLVLLSIIIVGQNIAQRAADQRAEDTYNDAELVLHTSREIQTHLHQQDREIEQILQHLQELESRVQRSLPKDPA